MYPNPRVINLHITSYHPYPEPLSTFGKGSFFFHRAMLNFQEVRKRFAPSFSARFGRTRHILYTGIPILVYKQHGADSSGWDSMESHLHNQVLHEDWQHSEETVQNPIPLPVWDLDLVVFWGKNDGPRAKAVVSGCVLQVCNTLPCELLEAFFSQHLGLLAAGTASRRRKRQTKVLVSKISIILVSELST